jgi:hypothetical protein
MKNDIGFPKGSTQTKTKGITKKLEQGKLKHANHASRKRRSNQQRRYEKQISFRILFCCKGCESFGKMQVLLHFF